jgi:arylsulfatase A-like enzyme
LWAEPGDQSIYLSTRFYERRGFRTFDGTSFPATDSGTNWGHSDKSLMRHMIAALDRTREPFAAMALTVTNHHPFQLPSDASLFEPQLPPEEWSMARNDRIVGERTIPMLRTMHYTDEALGEFFRVARTRPWFRHTIFVILGDHGTPTRPLHPIRSIHELMLLRHGIAMLIYSPMLPGGVVVRGPASQADILPTLDGLLGITGVRAGVGVDLLDPADRDEGRPVISWNPEAHEVSVISGHLTYHGVFENFARTPAVFGDEILVDTAADPVGLRNLAAERPRDTARLRAIARAYVEIYPWLVEHDRSGVPPDVYSSSGITGLNRVRTSAHASK